MKPCEGCGAPKPLEYGLHDYCAVCGATLCEECMSKGHCGNTPARSGMDEDSEDD